MEDNQELLTIKAQLQQEITAREQAEAALRQEVSAREGAEAALRQARDQFEAVLEAVPGGVSWVSSDMIYLGINRHLAWTFKSVPETFIGKPVGFLDNSPEFTQFVQQFFDSTNNSAHHEVHMDVLGADRIYLIMAQKYHNGDAAVFVGVDITERKQYEEQLLHDAFYDGLTGLPNRALFMDRLGRAVERMKRRSHYSFAVLFIDLDRFKVINDSLGHSAGDQLLQEVAQRLAACVRPSDTVARLGGDEFTILMDDIHDLSAATHLAERIQKELSVPFSLNEFPAVTAASIGIAMSASGYDRPEDLLRDADTALYRAKALGKARHEVFDTAMHAHAMTVLQVETELRRALETGQICLHYQPIISLGSDKLVSMEALARWQHPQRGLILPAEFIPVAEETGLIVLLDRWVLRQACLQMRAWQERFAHKPPLTISVNLSSKHFSHADMVDHIAATLRETGLDASSLNLEITESVIMENADSAAVTLTKLRAMGIHLSLDDFGTGYSSLSYLHRFPLNTLKIDRSFVNRIGPAGENSEIVRAIVTLAHNLGIDVVVEGVETTEQLVQVKSLKGTYGQGYLFSRPVDRAAAEALMEQGPQGMSLASVPAL